VITFKNEDVLSKFESYPSEVKIKLLHLRELIYKVAIKNNINDLEETLKWKEPSYLTKNGSTIRINYKKSSPENYSIYFNCKTKLISTFRELFNDKFTFVGNREIIFHKDDIIDTKSLEYCILLALSYHKRKHLFMLDEEDKTIFN
jgi:hypothetical protein